MAPLQLNNEAVVDQLIEYRARQQQKFAAAQLENSDATALDKLNTNLVADDTKTVQQDLSSVRAARPCALALDLATSSTRSSDSCPGTPREYRARQQQRFAAERQQKEEVAHAPDSTHATSQPAAPQEHVLGSSAASSSCSSCSSSPPTPRMHGSASLRAISAARAMREADAVPLPGAAWPGHPQSASASGNSSALPPRPRTSLKRASSRSGYRLPPLLPMARTLSSCAQAMNTEQHRALGLGPLVC